MGRLHKAEVMIAGEQLRYGQKEGQTCITLIIVSLCVFPCDPALNNGLLRTTEVSPPFW